MALLADVAELQSVTVELSHLISEKASGEVRPCVRFCACGHLFAELSLHPSRREDNSLLTKLAMKGPVWHSLDLSEMLALWGFLCLPACHF